MGVAVNALQGAREAVENVSSNAEAIRASATDTIKSALKNIRGSGSLMTEFKNSTDALLGMPASAVGGTLKATGRFLTLQPIKATQALAEGLAGTCKNLVKFATSPVPMVIAATENSYKTVRNAAVSVARLPKTAVLKGCDVVGRGVNEVLNLFGPTMGGTTGTPKAPDSNGAVTPEPAAAPAV